MKQQPITGCDHSLQLAIKSYERRLNKRNMPLPPCVANVFRSEEQFKSTLPIRLEVQGSFSKMALPDQYLPFASSSSALRWRAGTLQPQRSGNRWQGYKNRCISVVIGPRQAESPLRREDLTFWLYSNTEFSHRLSPNCF